MDNKETPDLDHVEAIKPATVPSQNHGDVLLVTSEDVPQTVFSLLSVSGIGTFMSTLSELCAQEGKSSEQVVGLSTYPTMVMALGRLGLLPLAFVFGRRPIFLYVQNYIDCNVTNLSMAMRSPSSPVHVTEMSA